MVSGLFLSAADLAGIRLCAFRQILGIDCPGCGLTRAFILIPRGELGAATALNAAAPLVYFFLFFLVVYLLWPRRILRNFLAFFAFVAVGVLLGQWAVKVYRDLPVFLEFIRAHTHA